jgi:hypothetical protein
VDPKLLLLLLFLSFSDPDSALTLTSNPDLVKKKMKNTYELQIILI